MADLDKALATQISNIQTKTGQSLDALFEHLRRTGLTRHGELRRVLMRDFGLGYGDANTIVHLHVNASAPSSEASSADPLDAIYAGDKAALRPIHDRLLQAIEACGPFAVAPKKAYVSLRRAKQFATVGPATRTRVDVGLNMKGVEATPRLVALPPGGMCQYKVAVSRPEDVDAELIAWIRRAYESAG